MALWIRCRPPERCNAAEFETAEMLAALPDDWLVRWGFTYRDQKDTERQGDFLILGPDGGCLVLEVKSGGISLNPYTGEWSTADGDDPREQLHAEWNGVREALKAYQGKRPSIFVGRALGAPELVLPPQATHHFGIAREFILDREDLRRFPEAWAARMEKWGARLDAASREVFLDCYAKDLKPASIRHFVDDIDRAILRQTEASYALLEQLAANRQFLVSGGVGSGKTWLAVELARRWAAEGGRHVLLLAYNLAFTEQLRELVERLWARERPGKGKIVVVAWEDLAKDLLEKAGVPYELPAAKEQYTAFYEITLPQILRRLAREGRIKPVYDALVVDEGQDHDTHLAGPEDEGSSGGWWPVYWALLTRGTQAPIGILYDAAQRPSFRGGKFDTVALLDTPGFGPVRIELKATLRYSRPVFRYLKGLGTPAVARLNAGLIQATALPHGPDVVVKTVPEEDVVETVDGILRGWFAQGWCRPEQVVILSRRGTFVKSVMAGWDEIGGVPLHDGFQPSRGSVGFGSVNRAKGLDRLAVVLVDFEPWPQRSDTDQVAFFFGASRARQLLAVVASG